MPATEHEVLEWMTDRQEEMTAALMARNPTEAARISSLITDATRSLQPESLHKRHEPSADTGCAVPGLEKLRIQDLPIFEDSGQSPVSSDGELLVRANMGRDVLPRVGGKPTDSPAPNMDAIQQTLVDTDSEDGRPLLQLEPPPKDVISALEADLVRNVAWDPISAVRGLRHQGASRRVALVPQSSQGTPRSIQDRNHCGRQCLCRTALQHWMRIHGLKCT